jgi:hypothetical protein
VAGVVAGVALALRTESPPRDPEQICSVFREKPHWYRDATRAGARWGTAVPGLMAVMLQESSLDARALPERSRLWGVIPWSRPSTAAGYAQVVDATWRHYEQEVGAERDREVFSHAADFVAWYLSELGEILALPARDLNRLYLAYHEGPDGYRRGSFRNKPWLEVAAAGVAQRAGRYRAQLEGCRDELDDRLWWRAFRGGALSVIGGLGALALLGWWLSPPRRARGRRGRRRRPAR